MDAQLSTIESYQTELEQTLEKLEKSVEEEMKQTGQTSLSNPDWARQESYEMAVAIDAELTSMTEVLSKIAQEMNEDAKTEMQFQGNNHLQHIQEILNAHHHSLCWIDQKVGTLRNLIQHVEGVF